MQFLLPQERLSVWSNVTSMRNTKWNCIIRVYFLGEGWLNSRTDYPLVSWISYPTKKHLTKTQKTADSDPYRVLLIVIRLQNLPYLLSCLPQFTKNNFLHQRLMAQAGSLHWTEGKTYLPLTWKVWFLQAIQEVQKIYEDIYDEYMKNPGKVNRTIYHYHLAVSSSPELKCFVLLFYYHIII